MMSSRSRSSRGGYPVDYGYAQANKRSTDRWQSAAISPNGRRYGRYDDDDRTMSMTSDTYSQSTMSTLSSDWTSTQSGYSRGRWTPRSTTPQPTAERSYGNVPGGYPESRGFETSGGLDRWGYPTPPQVHQKGGSVPSVSRHGSVASDQRSARYEKSPSVHSGSRRGGGESANGSVKGGDFDTRLNSGGRGHRTLPGAFDDSHQEEEERFGFSDGARRSEDRRGFPDGGEEEDDDAETCETWSTLSSFTDSTATTTTGGTWRSQATFGPTRDITPGPFPAMDLGRQVGFSPQALVANGRVARAPPPIEAIYDFGGANIGLLALPPRPETRLEHRPPIRPEDEEYNDYDDEDYSDEYYSDDSSDWRSSTNESASEDEGYSSGYSDISD